MRVLTIVVSHNWIPWLDRCLSSLTESTLIPDLYVFDNASDDDTLAVLESKAADLKHCIRIIVEKSRENLGFAQANNRGFEYALREGYDYVYLLNQDAWLMPDTIEKLVEASSGDSRYGLLSPLQMNGNMDALDAGFMKFNARMGGNAIVRSRFFPAAHWLIPVLALKKVGGFSPSFRHYGEDDNWVDRLHYHGFRSGVLPCVKAAHDRAGRRTTKAERCARKALIPVIRISDPHGWLLPRLIWAPLWLTGCGIKNLSFIPIKAIFSLLGRYGELKENRRLSKSTGAFLSKS